MAVPDVYLIPGYKSPSFQTEASRRQFIPICSCVNLFKIALNLCK